MPLQWVEERFWFRNGRGSRTSDGFLPTFGTLPVGNADFNADLLRRGDLAGSRNLAILGPPGSGKSEFLRSNRPLLLPEVTATPAFLDLSLFGSEDRLIAKLCQFLSPSATETGTGEVALVLDSFDEAQQRIPHLASILISELENVPSEKLWLRIGCRTSEWPSHLDAWLAERSGSLVAEFAPFRRDDAKQAAAGLEDPETFIRSIESRGLAPLASMPLSLDLLIRAYEGAGEIPAGRTDAYASGLLAMCDENNSQRRLSRGLGAAPSLGPSPSEVLAAGESVAACMMFTVKDRVWTGSIAEAEDTDLTLDDLVRFAEQEDVARLMDRQAFVSLFQTALFQRAGVEGLAWSHTTFLEFLAARWCAKYVRDRSRIENLLFAPDQKIFPIMRRLAAWLVSMDPASFGWIGEKDPESVASEIDAPDELLRSNVVKALIEHVKTGLHIHDWGINYSNLRYPALGHDIRAAIIEGPDEVRTLAIQIARDGQALGVQDDLLAIAMDPAESERVRYDSVVALRDLGWRGTELVALLEDPSLMGQDNNCELRGAVLDASWPHSLSTPDALKHATVPAPEWFMGHYSIAIHRLANGLSSADAEAAAGWLSQPVADSLWFEELRNAALAICAEHMDDVAARQSAVSAVRRKLRQYEPVFGTLGLKQNWPVSRRKGLVLAVAREASEEELVTLISDQKKGGLLSAEDFPWLVEELDRVTSDVAPSLLNILHLMFDPNRFDHANTLASLPPDHRLVMGPLAPWCELVELGSAHAEELRQVWTRWHRPARKAPTAIEDPIETWINTNLAAFDNGNVEAFEHALRLITVPPGSKHVRSTFQPDLTKHPRWTDLKQATRDSVISRASQYLTSASCQPEVWQEDDLSTASSEAAYRSMVLLLRTGNGLDSLPHEVWEEWAPGIVSWRPTVNGASEEDQEALIKRAKPHAHSSLVRALLAIIKIDASRGTPTHVGSECRLLWNEELSTGFATLLEQGPDSVSGDIATLLLEYDPVRARPILNNWIQDGSDDAAGLAVNCLLAHDAVTSWPAIKNVLVSRPSIVKKAVLNLANRERTDLNLTDEQLEFFHVWMEDNFPRQEDPQVVGAHDVSSREMVARWRDHLMEVLVGRGTQSSVQALRKFAALEPHDPWRMSVLARALRSRREAVWEPLDLSTLADFGRDRSKRLARTNRELLDVVLGALDTIQERLIGETPESHLLWDTRAMRPKSEDEISDYLLHRLRDVIGQVIVNREVQVRRNSPSGIPERADLLIEAAIPNEPNLRVVIEVKGAWSAELLTAIRAQLVDRYLTDFWPAAGIYLVLWPDVSSWREGPGQSDRNRLVTLDRAVIEAELNQQAAIAITNGYCVAVEYLDIPYRRTAT